MNNLESLRNRVSKTLESEPCSPVESSLGNAVLMLIEEVQLLRQHVRELDQRTLGMGKAR